MSPAPSVDEQWRWMMFELRLESCLPDLEDGAILILNRRDANQYVQIMRREHVGMVEAAGNHYIEPPHLLLTVAQHRRMLALGWEPANITPEECEAAEAARRFVAEPGRDGTELLDPTGAAITPPATEVPEHWESPNYHRRMNLRGELIIPTIVDTFRKVYRVRTPDDLVYASFHGESGEEILWPILGLDRAN